jgi:nicotinate-nucleotide adenylyltransferase
VGVSVGVLGGAFDPPHRGHVTLAVGGMERFELARLLVCVVADPGHKDVDTPAALRFRLATLAFAAVPGCEVALDEHARTVDSLEALALDDPVFLIGADEFASFLDWKDPDRVLELARLGVATRPGYPQERLDAVLNVLHRPDRVTLFEIEPQAVSSSQVRQLVGDGVSVDDLVPPGVADEIARLGLYRDTAEGGYTETE